MKHLLFIFNLFAGKAKIRTQLYSIIEYYKLQGYITTIYPTSNQGDGYSFISQMKEQYDLIVCSGGDGTLNEIVSGLLDSGNDTVLGYIPSGSTNDFSKSMGISGDLNQAMEISCCGKIFNLDVGCLNNRFFVYVAGFGAFTKISYATPQKMKNTLGYLAYLFQGIKELSELHEYDLMIRYENGTIQGRYIVGLVMNSFSIAGFRNPTSSLTELNDGIFEVMLVRMPQNIIELQKIIASLMGNPLDCEYIECFQASYMEINSKPMEWTVDGEYGGKYEHTVIEIKNKAISVLVGQEN